MLFLLLIIVPPKGGVNIGKDNNNKIAVINTAHTNNGIFCIVIPGALIFNIVDIKFIEDNKELIPAFLFYNPL